MSILYAIAVLLAVAALACLAADVVDWFRRGR